MERFIQLNLQTPSEKTEATNLPEPEPKDVDAEEEAKRLSRIANRAAHRAASEYSRGSSGLFSK